jgi:hypothetical protein
MGLHVPLGLSLCRGSGVGRARIQQHRKGVSDMGKSEAMSSKSPDDCRKIDIFKNRSSI